MTTKAQLRKAALAMPEVAEGTHFGQPAFTVRGKGFVSVDRDGSVLLRLEPERVAAIVADHPGSEPVERAGKPIGLRVALADVDGQQLNWLVRQAWFHRAPKRLAAELAAADRGVKPAGCDLPDGIGGPATHALLGAGVTTLAQVATHSRAELRALHGVGPKAVRILAESLTENDLSFRG